MLTPMIPGAALFKLVLIKPADDPHLAPDKDFCSRIFWYDPDSNGHSAGIREVYPQPSPVVIGQVVAAVIEQTKSPATDVHGYTIENRLNLIDRAETIKADALKRADRLLGRERKDAIEPGGLLTEAQRSSLFKGDLSEIGNVLLAISVPEDATPISGQDDRSGFEHHGSDVKELHHQASVSSERYERRLGRG